ncbi:MAG TPA: HYR domain-containing protein, partial [Flavobacteriales bacterium]|nr:HYR domain-containing protein [Flavobacteriales bacterium]
FTLPPDAGSIVACPADMSTPTPPAVQDDCGQVITPVGPVVSNTPICDGDVTYVWTYEDCAGHVHDWTYTYTITHDQPPVEIGGPMPTSASVQCYADAVPPQLLVIQDQCGDFLTPGVPMITDHYDHQNGTTTVTYSYTYVYCAGQYIWSFVYTVDDTQDPVVVDCPADINVETNSGNCDGAVITWDEPTATDNCGLDMLMQTMGPLSGSFFAVGPPTTIEYTAYDLKGNISTCSFTVTVTITDADGDGICDHLDNCPSLPGVIGDPCDDGDPNTINDVLDANCECHGIPLVVYDCPGLQANIGDPCDDGDDDTMDDMITPSCQCAGTPFVVVAPKALLQGPYANGLMKDDLRSNGLIPLAQPYNLPAFGNYNGGEIVAPAVLANTGNDAIVDWIMVELRDKNAPGYVVARRAALIQRDGDIVDTDGISPVRFMGVVAGPYYVAIRHRNHLGVMGAATVTLSHSPAQPDFTDVAYSTYGSGAQSTVGGKHAMWCGNANTDQSLKYSGSGNDRDPILVAIGAAIPTKVINSVYAKEDVTMDGKIGYSGQGNDRDPILVNVGSSIPTTVKSEQLP